MDTKAAFEKWWKDEYSHLESSKYTDLVPHIKYGFFQAWTASRAAIEIELRKISVREAIDKLESREVETVSMNVSYKYGWNDCIEAITSHGIRIKGKTE